MRILPIAALAGAACLTACPSTGSGPAADTTTTTATGTDEPPIVDDREVRYIKVYTGGDGLRVTVVRFMPPHADEALLEITGTDSKLDSLVIAHRMVDDHYEATIEGSEHWTMRPRGGPNDDGEWNVWYSNKEHVVAYDEEATAAADAEAVVRRHHEQVASGAIAAIERFNREERMAFNEEQLAKAHARAADECGYTVGHRIAWDTIDDATMSSYSVYGYCSHAISAVRTMCGRDTSYRALIRAEINEIECRFGDTMSLTIADGVLVFTTRPKESNVSVKAGVQLARMLTLNPTVLSTGRGHYLLLDPVSLYNPVDDPQLYFGDVKVVHAQRYRPRNTHFYQGEFWAPREEHVTGIDLVDGTWVLTCGERKTDLTELTGAERTALLDGVEKREPLWEYEPYLLARDDLGNYYYVDRLRNGGKGFRVFRGPKGLLKLTRLVNIVEDAQGEIFATKAGSLRLVVDNDSERRAWWLEGDDKTPLVTVPIDQSQKLIYSQLGVYDGQDLGTPCDQY